jgi:hypothetical protein
MKEEKVEFEEIQETEGKNEKKWNDMTGMQKFLYVLRIVLGILALGGAFAGGWASRGKVERSRAAKRDNSSERKVNVQQPGMRPKTSTSERTSFMNSGSANRSVDQLTL